MMYMHYCRHCLHIHILNGHKRSCPKCGESLAELRITYQEYSCMNRAERKLLATQCLDAGQLAALETTYRMHKYSKWYKKLQTSS